MIKISFALDIANDWPPVGNNLRFLSAFLITLPTLIIALAIKQIN